MLLWHLYGSPSISGVDWGMCDSWFYPGEPCILQVGPEVAGLWVLKGLNIMSLWQTEEGSDGNRSENIEVKTSE